MDFNRSKDTYRSAIEGSIAFSGKGLDFFTKVKADYVHQIVDRDRSKVGPPRILDVGCGHGLIHPYLRSFGYEIVGIEMASEVLPLARAANPEVSYVGYDGQRLPFASNSFDVVLAICVMHHVVPVERYALLREMRRVLRPQGLAVVFEHNPFNPLTQYVVARLAIDADANLLSARSLHRLMHHADLNSLRTKHILFTPFAHPWLRWLDVQLGWLPFGAQYYTVGVKG